MISHLALVIALKKEKRISCFHNECQLNQWRTLGRFFWDERQKWNAGLLICTFSPLCHHPPSLSTGTEFLGTTHSHICDRVASGRLSQCRIPSNVGMSATPTSLLTQVTKQAITLFRYLHLRFHHKCIGALNFWIFNHLLAAFYLPVSLGGGGFGPAPTGHSYGPGWS